MTWAVAIGLASVALAAARRHRPAETKLGSFIDGSARWRRVRLAIERQA